MAFPTIPTVAAGRVLTAVQANTTATRTFPNLSGLTKNQGDLLIAIVIAYQSSVTDAAFSSWGGGFTEFHDSSSSTTMAIGIAYKWSDGTESGTFSVTQAATITGHAALILLSIPGAHASSPPEAGSRASGTSAAADPASFDPAGWDSEDTLWIAVGGSGETSTTGSYTGLASAPTNYSDYADSGISQDVVGGCEAAVAFRQLAAASENVGTFSVDVSNARNAAVVIAIRPAPAVQEVTGAGNIATAEAFGTAALDLNINPGGVASAEAFGSSTVSVLTTFEITAEGGGLIGDQIQDIAFNIRITAKDNNAATYAEFTGTVTVSVPGATMSQGGGATASFTAGVLAAHTIAITTPGNWFVHVDILSGAAEEDGDSNSFNVLAGILPGGIPSGGALGSPALEMFVDASAIASVEAFGAAALDLTLSPGAVAGAEAFGLPALDYTLNPGAIASAEAFGTALIDQPQIDPAGVVSAEAFGTAALDLTLDPSGVASAEAFGTTVVDRPHVDPAGIASAEAFGTATVEEFTAGEVTGVGNIASAEAFGALIVDRPHVDPASIASSEAFGLLSLDAFLNPVAISAGETFGIPVVDRPHVDPVGIASAQAFGTPEVAEQTETFIDPAGLASAEAFGLPYMQVFLLTTEEMLVLAARVARVQPESRAVSVTAKRTGFLKLERRGTVVVPATSEDE